MPTADEARYNSFGKYVAREKGDTSINTVARRAGIPPANLSRWMRSDPFMLPDPGTLQALARALNRPLGQVQAAALEASGHTPPPGQLSLSQMTITNALYQLDEYWQQMLADMVLRVVEEISRRNKP